MWFKILWNPVIYGLLILSLTWSPDIFWEPPFPQALWTHFGKNLTSGAWGQGFLILSGELGSKLLQRWKWHTMQTTLRKQEKKKKKPSNAHQPCPWEAGSHSLKSLLGGMGRPQNCTVDTVPPFSCSFCWRCGSEFALVKHVGYVTSPWPAPLGVLAPLQTPCTSGLCGGEVPDQQPSGFSYLINEDPALSHL